jgi:hypothetical protein
MRQKNYIDSAFGSVLQDRQQNPTTPAAPLKKLRGQFHAEMNEEIIVENSSFS